MPAQTKSRSPQTKTPLQKGAWWKKLLIALCGTYIASKILGITLPSISSASFPSHTDRDTYGSRQSADSADDLPADEYLDDTWDEPDEIWQTIQPHGHAKADDIWICIEGEGVFYPAPGEERLIAKGDVIVSAKGMCHGMKNTGTKDFVFVGILAPVPADYFPIEP